MESLMTCQEFLARHAEYMDELLNQQEVARCEAHLATCAACARYDRVVRQGIRLLRATPEIEPSADFFPRLQHRLYHLEDELRAGTRGPGASAVVSLAIAGVLAFLAWSPLMRLDQVFISVPGSADGWTAELSEPAVGTSIDGGGSSANARGTSAGIADRAEPRPFDGAPSTAAVSPPSSIRPIEPMQGDWTLVPIFPGEGAAQGWAVSDSHEGLGHGLDLAPMTPWLAPRTTMPYSQSLTGERRARAAGTGAVRTVGDTLSPRN